MEGKKRQRASNFTIQENMFLCKLIEKYKHILGNKKTDGNTLAEKRKAWIELTEEYNASITHVPRSLKSLISAYKNLKKKEKRLPHSIANKIIPGRESRYIPETTKELPTHIHTRKKKKYKTESFVKELAELQTIISREQLDHQRKVQEAELQQLRNKIEFDKAKQETEIKYLKEKYELELLILRNNLHT